MFLKRGCPNLSMRNASMTGIVSTLKAWLSYAMLCYAMLCYAMLCYVESMSPNNGYNLFTSTLARQYVQPNMAS